MIKVVSIELYIGSLFENEFYWVALFVTDFYLEQRQLFDTMLDSMVPSGNDRFFGKYMLEERRQEWVNNANIDWVPCIKHYSKSFTNIFTGAL